MRVEDFELLSTLLKKRSGLVLTEDKSYLLETRLMPVARKHALKGLEELCTAVKIHKNAAIISDITEAMTTNETLFFRDTRPFDLFKDHLLPQLISSRSKTRRLRIWCAASSGGQEPYSIAMILKEMQAKLSGWRIEIMATDISVEMLDKARAGLYTQFEVQRGLPITLLVKYFKQTGDKWQLDSSIRSMVQFKPFNLMENPRSLGDFDVIFCRNVLIYFDQPTKKMVLDNVAKMLPNDGALFLGGAETVLGVTESFKPVAGRRGLYQLQNGDVGI